MLLVQRGCQRQAEARTLHCLPPRLPLSPWTLPHQSRGPFFSDSCPLQPFQILSAESVRTSQISHRGPVTNTDSHEERFLSHSFSRVSLRTSLVVQWLRLCASNAGYAGLIPGQGTKIPHAVWQKKKKKLLEPCIDLSPSPMKGIRFYQPTKGLLFHFPTAMVRIHLTFTSLKGNTLKFWKSRRLSASR